MIGGIGYGSMGTYGMSDMYGVYGSRGVSAPNGETNVNSATMTALKRMGKVECETCANRKYQDGSNEGDVSFKSPSHVDPGASASAVMAHEQQHVANAYEKAGRNNGQVIRASVKLETAVCPECGRSYVSGGETSTMIKYNESNPYSKAAKVQDASVLVGRNVNYAV